MQTNLMRNQGAARIIINKDEGSEEGREIKEPFATGYNKLLTNLVQRDVAHNCTVLSRQRLN